MFGCIRHDVNVTPTSVTVPAATRAASGTAGAVSAGRMVSTSPAATSVGALWPDLRPDAARRLLLAAVESFAARGYHATTTRDISARAGVSPGTLYVHFATKAEVLARISIDGHRSTLALVTSAVKRASNPPARITALVEAFVRWHAEHHVVARVVQYELTALPPETFAEVAALRRRIEALVRAEILAGVETGDFVVADVPSTARAILSLGIDVARWYGVGSRHRPDAADLARGYADLALRMLGAPGGPGAQSPLSAPGGPGARSPLSAPGGPGGPGA